MALKSIFNRVLFNNHITNNLKCSIYTTKQCFSYRVDKERRVPKFMSRGELVLPQSDKLSSEIEPDTIVELTEKEISADSKLENANDDSKLKYEKITENSPIITKFMVNVKSRKKREQSGQILLEGKRLIQDALDAGVTPISMFFSRISDVAPFNLDSDVKLYRVPYKCLQFWSDVATSQGVVGIFGMPDTSKYDMRVKLPLTIVCDNVRDPGNLGSVLRTAAAVGCQKLLLTQGCVDLWESKVLRSAAGAHFRTCIQHSLTWADVNNLLTPDACVYLADSNVPPPTHEYQDIDVYEVNDKNEKVPVLSEPPKRITSYQRYHSDDHLMPLVEYSQVKYTGDTVLIIGGETHGLSQEARQLAHSRGGQRVFVPLNNGVESLNSGTALGILAYEIRRQLEV